MNERERTSNHEQEKGPETQNKGEEPKSEKAYVSMMRSPTWIKHVFILGGSEK
jgi:hypothetical protein